MNFRGKDEREGFSIVAEDRTVSLDELERVLSKQLQPIRDDIGVVKDTIGVLSSEYTWRLTKQHLDSIAEKCDCDVWQVLKSQDVADLFKSFDTTDISSADEQSFKHADFILMGIGKDTKVVFIAIEASYTIRDDDVRRAVRNAKYIQQFKGCMAYAVVSGVRTEDHARMYINNTGAILYSLPRNP